MHVALEAIMDWSHRTGIENYVYHLSLELIHGTARYDGHEYYLISNKDFASNRAGSVNEMAVPGCLALPWYILPFTPWYLVYLPILLRHMDVDVFHSPLFLRVPPFCDCASVITVHDLSPVDVPETFPRMYSLLVRQFLRLACKQADAIIFVSRYTKRRLVERYGIPPDKITVTYHGVDNKFMPIQDSQLRRKVMRRYGISGRFILSLGTLQPRKNLIALLKAYDDLAKNSSLAHQLVIAGKKGWAHKGIFQTVRQLDLQDRVVFPGYVCDEDLPALYSAADVFVYPSLYEGFGLPVVEAMACGTPVVCSRSTSLPEIVGGAGALINPHNVEELSKCIFQVLTNERLKNQLRQAGLVRSRDFAWSKTVSRTIAVYEKAHEKYNGQRS